MIGAAGDGEVADRGAVLGTHPEPGARKSHPSGCPSLQGLGPLPRMAVGPSSDKCGPACHPNAILSPRAQ